MRPNNEDSVYAGPRLLALADGMGGHAAGEVASNVVISTLAHLDEDRPVDDLISTLRDATAAANNNLRAMVEQDSNLDGMGTTLVCALLTAEGQALIANVGDSRAVMAIEDEQARGRLVADRLEDYVVIGFALAVAGGSRCS